MPKTVSRTIADIVIADVVAVNIVRTPAIKILATAFVRDDGTGEQVGRLSFEVEVSPATLASLSTLLAGDILAAANTALQTRGETDVQISAP